MRSSFQTRLLLQAFLDRPEDELYGFELSRATNLQAGTLYPILQRLLREGWLTARWETIDESAAGRRRRRYYKLSALGERSARAVVASDSTPLRQLMPGWVS